MVAQSIGFFGGNILDNPRNESCKAIGFRNRVVPTIESLRNDEKKVIEDVDKN